MNLKRNHRDVGRVVSEQDGYTVLETAPQTFTAAPSHMLLPATPADVSFDLRMLLNAAIERARFLGVPDDALRNLFDEELRNAAP